MRFVISGCSSGGKSTLLQALADVGEIVVPEPGRRVVQAGIDPYGDPVAFCRACLTTAMEDLRMVAEEQGPVFFDRSAVDALCNLERLGAPLLDPPDLCYHRLVFLAPPWPEIYTLDADRKHGLADAIAEYDALVVAYQRRGHDLLTLPKASVAERVAFIRHHVAGLVPGHTDR
ncbi:MAG: AAA family ATPase [Pseudomonadota bacterium]